MKSKIKVLFESLISCGKPAKGDDKDQGSIVTDDSKHAQQEQEQEHQKVTKDEQKHAQGHGLIVKHEPNIAQGQVKDETKKAKEQVQGAFVYKATTYQKITISSLQARSPSRRRPRSPPTG